MGALEQEIERLERQLEDAAHPVSRLDSLVAKQFVRLCSQRKI